MQLMGLSPLKETASVEFYKEHSDSSRDDSRYFQER